MPLMAHVTSVLRFMLQSQVIPNIGAQSNTVSTGNRSGVPAWRIDKNFQGMKECHRPIYKLLDGSVSEN